MHGLVARDGLFVLQQQRDVVEAVEQPVPAAARLAIVATTSSPAAAVSRPFWTLLDAKMSANDGAITTRKPKSLSAHTACSRDEPQPKLAPATSTEAPAYSGRSRTMPSPPPPASECRQS